MTHEQPPESWPAYFWYEAMYWVSMTGMTLGSSLRTQGRSAVPPTGPVLLIANHQSFLDPVLIGLAARRHLCFLARQTLFASRAFAWLIRSLHAVPIDQEGLGIQGLRTIVEQLRRGRAVVVFPEGERTPDGTMQPLRPGIHLLIKRTQAPIVPVGIAGAFECWPRTRSFPIPAPLFLPAGAGTIAVVVGRPLHAESLVGLQRDRVLDTLTAAVQDVYRQAEHLRRKP